MTSSEGVVLWSLLQCALIVLMHKYCIWQSAKDSRDIASFCKESFPSLVWLFFFCLGVCLHVVVVVVIIFLFSPKLLFVCLLLLGVSFLLDCNPVHLSFSFCWCCSLGVDLSAQYFDSELLQSYFACGFMIIKTTTTTTTRRQIEVCFQPWYNPLWLTRLKTPNN